MPPMQCNKDCATARQITKTYGSSSQPNALYVVLTQPISYNLFCSSNSYSTHDTFSHPSSSQSTSRGLTTLPKSETASIASDYATIRVSGNTRIQAAKSGRQRQIVPYEFRLLPYSSSFLHLSNVSSDRSIAGQMRLARISPGSSREG